MALCEIRFWQTKSGKKPVEKWIDELTNEQRLRVAKLLRSLAHSGRDLMMPESRYLGAKLFELREKQDGLRVYYTFFGSTIAVLVAGGDKDSQERGIVLARERMKAISVK